MIDRILELKNKYDRWAREVEAMGNTDMASTLHNMSADLEAMLKDNDRFEFKTAWCISSAHISKAAHDLLDAEEGLTYVSVYNKETFGWYLYPTYENDLPDDAEQSLKDILQMAKSMGVSMIEVDCDGPEVEGLPKYNW